MTSIICLFTTKLRMHKQNQTYQAWYGGVKCSHVMSSTNQIAAFGHVTSSFLNQSDCSTPPHMHKWNQKCPNAHAQLDESLQYGSVSGVDALTSSNHTFLIMPNASRLVLFSLRLESLSLVYHKLQFLVLFFFCCIPHL